MYTHSMETIPSANCTQVVVGTFFMKSPVCNQLYRSFYLLFKAELDPVARQSDCDLVLLEAVEGQVAHHGAQAASQAGVGCTDNTETIQILAG